MIDNHPLMCQALELYRQGRQEEAEGCEEAFLAAVFAAGLDHCPCATPCKIHGDCRACVATHRGHGDHLPHCLQAIGAARPAVPAIDEAIFSPPDGE